MESEAASRPGLFQNRRVDVTLSLRDRVRVIEAYKTQRSYDVLAIQFNCSVNEIKNIHRRGRQRAIADFVTRKAKEYLGIKQIRSDNDPLFATFLDKFVYEWFQRAQRRPEIGTITDKLILKMAQEAIRLLPIKNFELDMNWVAKFRKQFDITDLEMSMLMIKDDHEPVDLDMQEIALNVMDQHLTSTHLKRLSETNDSDIELVDHNFDLEICKNLQLPELHSNSSRDGQTITDEDLAQNNTLSLRDRIRVINAYRHEPSYNILAKQFNCSALEIRKIHRRGRQRVYTEFIKSKTKEFLGLRHIKSEYNALVVPFLENLVYEWIQRARRHTKNDALSNQLILIKAEEAKRILPMKNFKLDLDWVLKFRQKYDITDVDITMLKVRDDNEPVDLDMHEIAVYVLDQHLTSAQRSNYGSECDSLNGTVCHQLELLEQICNSSADGSKIADGDSEANQVEAMEVEMPPISKDEEVQRYLKPVEDYALINENFRAIGLIEQLRAILRHDK